MSLKNFHEVVKYNSLCNVTDQQPFNDRVLITGAENYLQGLTGGEAWTEFFVKSKDLKYRIDGFGIQEENDIVFLIISDFNQGEVDVFVDAIEIINSFNELCQFVFLLRNGKLVKSFDESEQDLISVLEDLKDQVEKGTIELIYLTNKFVESSETEKVRLPDCTYPFRVIDLEQMYQFHLSDNETNQNIEINIKDLNKGNGMPVLKAGEISDVYEGYLFPVSGRLLATIYNQYKVALLESNVRFYLHAKGQTNKGILKTIEESPEMFFAYNNGLSATCTDVTIEEGELISIKGLQIVNGGQSTASIHAVLNTSYESNLDKLLIQVKLTRIKDVSQKDNLVSKISKYANTQNGIKSSDLSSNDEFIVQMEEFSRRMSPPSREGTIQSKWFFERKIGEYSNLQFAAKQSGRFNSFEKEFPKIKVVKKTDFAKILQAWGLPNKSGNLEPLPYEATKSAEINFKRFMEVVSGNNIVVNESFFKEAVAKIILFRAIYSLLPELGINGYKSNVALYTLSWLSYLCKSKIDFNLIWDRQEATPDMTREIKKMIPIVHEVILTPNNKGSEYYGANIGEFTKKDVCWKILKKKKFSINICSEDLNADHSTKKDTAVEFDENDSRYWKYMAVWAKTNGEFNGGDRKMMYTIGKIIENKWKPTDYQDSQRVILLERAKSEGYQYID
jgi:hypothetical protein